MCMRYRIINIYQVLSIPFHHLTMTDHTRFTNPPPLHPTYILSFPHPKILLITLSREEELNCINIAGHHSLDAVYNWFDDQPSLNVAVLTGAGRAFCAGADLKEWNIICQSNSSDAEDQMPASGFGGLSQRRGKKPVIAAVNGICFGGGCEMAINADMILADENAEFALPEVKVGVVAISGVLARLARTVGKQRASEMCLTGRKLSAHEAKDWGLVNRVVKRGKCVEEAIEMAELVSRNSPDSIIVTREGIKMSDESFGVDAETRLLKQLWYSRIYKGANMREGIKSFVDKRKPNWMPSKL